MRTAVSLLSLTLCTLVACGDDSAMLIAPPDGGGTGGDASLDPDGGVQLDGARSDDGGSADAALDGDGAVIVPDSGADAGVEPDGAAACAGATVCSTAIDLGIITADDHAAPAPYPFAVSGDGNTSTWYKVTLAETILGEGGGALTAQITVNMAPGADYDVTAYCLACGGAVAATGIEAVDGDGNEFEYLLLRRDDVSDVDQTYDVLIEVAHVSGACGYTVRVDGHVFGIEAPTCE